VNATKPKLFVGSSTKGLPYARALQTNLQYEARVRLWPQGIFGVGQYPLESLVVVLDDVDFGAFIFLPEDTLIMRGTQSLAVRDNVLFELGMFIGRLGRDRSFLIKPVGHDLHLPTDLAGIISAEFDSEDSNVASGIGPASTNILSRMIDIGPRTSTRILMPGSLPGYDRKQALEVAIQNTNRASAPVIHGKKYSRNEVINESGDSWAVEKFEGIEALSSPVSELPTSYTSKSGRPTVWRCESSTPNQEVSCTVLEPENHENRLGVYVFTPALTNGRPVSFKAERNVLNAISFARQDDSTQFEESIRISFRHLYDACMFHLSFPPRHFPKRFRIAAYRQPKIRDEQESAFVENQVDIFPETANLILNIPTPFPGFVYELNWELPTEESELRFTPIQLGFVEEMTRRLGGLRIVSGSHAQGARKALSGLREKILGSMAAGENIELTLYSYDRQKSGLICVASVDADEVERAWANYLFKPGRGVVGFAFRKRQIVPYRREEGDRSPQTDRYEFVAGENKEIRPWFVIAIPMFYAGCRDRCVGILSIASRHPHSRLSSTASEVDRFNSLIDIVEKWYSTDLAQALGIIPTSVFWNPSEVRS